MTYSIRSNIKIKNDREKIKNIILKDFKDKQFYVRDVYDKIHPHFNRSTLCGMFNDFKSLVTSGFLRYSIKDRRARYRLKAN